MKLKELAAKMRARLAAMKARLAADDAEGKKQIDDAEAELAAAEAPAEDTPEVETKEKMKARHGSELESIKARHLEEAKSQKIEEIKARHDAEMTSLTEKHAEQLKKAGFVDEAAPSTTEADPAPAGDGPAEKPEQAKMKAVHERVTRLQASLAAGQKAARVTRLQARLTGLRASQKITPAEIKKIDLVKLAAENDATVDAVFKSYESREPVILVGMVGSATAEDIGAVSREMRIRRLEAETRANMPLKAAEAKSRLGAAEDLEGDVSVHVDAVPQGQHDGDHPVEMTSLEAEFKDLDALMGEPDLTKAREKLKKLADELKRRLAGEPPAAGETLTEIEDGYKKMASELAEITTLVSITG